MICTARADTGTQSETILCAQGRGGVASKAPREANCVLFALTRTIRYEQGPQRRRWVAVSSPRALGLASCVWMSSLTRSMGAVAVFATAPDTPPCVCVETREEVESGVCGGCGVVWRSTGGALRDDLRRAVASNDIRLGPPQHKRPAHGAGGPSVWITASAGRLAAQRRERGTLSGR